MQHLEDDSAGYSCWQIGSCEQQAAPKQRKSRGVKYKNSLKTEDLVVDETQELSRVFDGSKADGLHENRGMVQDEIRELYMRWGKAPKESTVSKRVLNLRTWSLIRTFFGILGPYYISGSLFSLFWFHSRKECQFFHICRHWFWFALLANFDFYLCLRINFHTSAFWVLILAAGVLIGSLFHKKMGPYWVLISKLGGPY